MKMRSRRTTILCFTSLILLTLVACQRNELIPSTPSAAASQAALQPGDATPSAAASQAALQPGDTTMFLVYDGLNRSFVIHIPPALDASQPVPLVLAFHGVGLDANEMIRISGFNSQSDVSGFIVVYPNGTGENKSWNGGHCCGSAAMNNVDDIGFVRALIGELSTFINIDPKRIFATGFSNGAIFTYRVACELSDLIAAVGPVSATQALEDMQACEPERPVPVIHFHGTADEPNPYNGGVSPGGFQFIPVSTAIQFWVDFNGCPAQPQTTESGSIRDEIYSPCESGSAVELYTIAGGMHAWPGGEAVNLIMGEPTMEISATALMWEFFISHPMP